MLERQPRAVERAPEHERPRRAVPEPAEQHRQEQVAVGLELPPAVAAERDVEEVAQEAAERHVPAAPEVAEPERAVRRHEVLREDVAHQQREPDRDVRVAGEVAVDLRRVRVGGHPHVRRAVGLRHREHRVDDRAREVVGDHDLLDQAEPDQRQAGADRDLVRVARRLQLGQELAGAHDRAGDEVGEEAQVERDVDRAGGLDQPALDVDHVGDRLEREEADPDRERDRQQRQRHPEPDAVERVGDALGEEAVVLEDRQDDQVERDRGAHDPLAPALVVRAVQELRRRLVAERDRAQEQAEPRVRAGVEEVAREDDERLPQPLARHQRPGEGQNDREEDRELDCREQHESGNLPSLASLK